MTIAITRSLLAALMLSAALVSVHAGDGEKKKECCAAANAQPCCKLLKGIVHLNDNDIRFSRKGGGIVFVDPTTGPDAAKALAGASGAAVKAGATKCSTGKSSTGKAGRSGR